MPTLEEQRTEAQELLAEANFQKPLLEIMCMIGNVRREMYPNATPQLPKEMEGRHASLYTLYHAASDLFPEQAPMAGAYKLLAQRFGPITSDHLDVQTYRSLLLAELRTKAKVSFEHA